MVSKHLKLYVFAGLLALTACSKDKDDKKEPPKGDVFGISGEIEAAKPPRNRRQLKIVDQAGLPIAGAQILLGDSLDQPFANNFLNSNADGIFIAPKEWKNPVTVTIAAPGYVRASYLAQTPSAQNFSLRKIIVNQEVELSGQTSGFKVKDKDGIVDFGFVIGGLKKQDLFLFDITTVISSEMDEITVLGKKMSIPTNVTLPKQKESYILPFTLEKPKYRMKFREAGPTVIYAARGQFPLKQVIDQMQNGKEFYELINYFSIQAGTVKTIDLKAGRNNGDIAIEEMPFTQSKSVMAPLLPSDQVVVSAAVSESLGIMYPTDFKGLENGKATKLVMPASTTSYILSVLKRKDEMTSKEVKNVDRLSATLVPFTDKITPTFLPLLDDPVVQNLTHIQLNKVDNIPGLNPLGTYLVLSKVEERQSGKYTFEVLHNQWEVFGATWVESVALPTWPGEDISAPKLRWEASYIAAPMGVATPLGPEILNKATHTTHASRDF